MMQQTNDDLMMAAGRQVAPASLFDQAHTSVTADDADTVGYRINLDKYSPQPIPSGAGGGQLDSVGARLARNVGWLVSSLGSALG